MRFRSHDILTALVGLEESDREVLLLAGWYDLNAQEAAQAPGCTQNAYGVRLHRARRRLRAVFDESPRIHHDISEHAP